MEIKNNNLSVGDVVVSTWGATMILADFGEVVKVSPKSVVIETLAKQGMSEQVIDGVKYAPDYGRPYVMPMKNDKGYVREHIQRQHGEPEKIRLYCKTMTRNLGGEDVKEIVWFSKIRRFAKIYDKWDGKPIQEDHND